MPGTVVVKGGDWEKELLVKKYISTTDTPRPLRARQENLRREINNGQGHPKEFMSFFRGNGGEGIKGGETPYLLR